MTCNPATCPNGKCNATGECVEDARPGVATSLVPLTADSNRFAKLYPDAIAVIPQGYSAPLDVRTTYEVAHGIERSSGPGRTIIAFTGLAGAGKSTAAQYLVERHGFQRVRFAGPLKSMLAALGCTHEQIDGSEKETPCDLLCGKTPRQAMQWLGTEFGRNLIGDDLWIRAWKAAVDRLPAGVPVVVDDLRFPNEEEAVRAAGGVIVRIDRPGAGTTSTHVSEQHTIEAAETLRNVADPRALFDLVDILVMDLGWRDAA